MFSIAAINDTESRGQWVPLAPTKEAQEFHLTQTYHEGLLKLQAKEYAKARELLENVLKDPLISDAQVDNTASDGHLLQLRFLTLKNLAAVFLEQGSAHYESALQCYLQAVEIDAKDSVIWNQLGTLACSMGLWSISRWAFEQGLLCSPNNWNCMEKLLEVLIAIGDEVACLSVAELILQHWPSHSRALHVKRTIEESEPIPFAPRGIDKLEPKHVRLKFGDKRKAKDDSVGEKFGSKRLNDNLELHVEEVSWTALAGAIIGILLPFSGRNSEQGAQKSNMSGDTRLLIKLHSSVEKDGTKDVEIKGSCVTPGENVSEDSQARNANINDNKETHHFEEQTYERRSTRLESLRSQKPGKEESEFAGSKDTVKIVIQFLEPFVTAGDKTNIEDRNHASDCSLDNEIHDVMNFVTQNTKNFGAYQLGHLLLEEVEKRGLLYRETFTKFLELEKLTRYWGRDRTPECSLFLAELYYELGSLSSDTSTLSEHLSEASYHLCKIIESVALDYPSNLSGSWSQNWSSPVSNSQNRSKMSSDGSRWLSSSTDGSILSEKNSLWVRFFWLSGHISIWEGDVGKAHREYSISLNLLENNRNLNLNDLPGSVQLPHCKISKELTIDKIRHEINLLEVKFLMKDALDEMLEKEMYAECIELFAPLLLSAQDVHLDVSPVADKSEGVASGELAALDALIKACEKTEPLNIDVWLNSHWRRLQILMLAAGMGDFVASPKISSKSSVQRLIAASEAESNGSSDKHFLNLVADEVKTISQCASQVKNFLDQHRESSDIAVPKSIIANLQFLLLALMCNIARTCFCKKSDEAEQRQKRCFVDAAIAFCKLQHLDLSIPIKNQIDLIVAIHNLLAEFGICCVGEDGEVVDGTFLKLAIKHLLALDMKLKSYDRSLSKGPQESVLNNQFENDSINISSDQPNMEMGQTADVVTNHSEKAASRNIRTTENDNEVAEASKNHGGGFSDEKLSEKEKAVAQSTQSGIELAEDEREELELGIDSALDQCFFCLYGLNLRSDSSYEDDLAEHKNASHADYQSKEQCADVFNYILPYAKASTKTGLVKLRRVLRTIRKHFPQPPEDVLAGNLIDQFLDDPNLCEDKLSEQAGTDGFDSMIRAIFPDGGILKQNKISARSCETYLEVYSNLYYLLAQSEETSASDKWPGFVLTKEGEQFVEQSANLSKYDLLFNPLRFESWQRLANIYDEEVDLLLNDGSKNMNVGAWRKNPSLPQRVETSRRRSRRCLLMSLDLAKTPEQQSEIHELLALVYYDGLQNVVPIFDQRSIAPSKDATWVMFCRNSMKHFEKAFAYKQDWSHAFYLGKLCETLGYAAELSFSYYEKAISLNPSAADAFYRMHASRLKLLYTSQRHDIEVLKVSADYCFNQYIKETVMNILGRISLEKSQLQETDINTQATINEKNTEESHRLHSAWHLLYNDCLAALQICVEGDLKHFHKARYMLAQGLYRRDENGDLDKAKDELSFCFKSSRSSFTINMWEIDSMVKKGRRKAPFVGGNKKALEVNLPESSRKFITCIRKYLIFYLRLLEETGDIFTLDRAYASIRADKRFSLCLEDLVPVALGRYLKALIASFRSADIPSGSGPEQILEKMFALFMEQGILWPDLCNLPEIKCPELSESTLYGYLHQYLYSLERNSKLETLEAINEKIRKRFKNPKLSSSNCAKVCKHASMAWCRLLLINLVSITPLLCDLSGQLIVNQSENDSENTQLLCVNIQTDEIWNFIYGDPTHMLDIKTKWDPLLARVRNVIIKRASDEKLEIASSLLRSAYSFYRDSSSVVLSSGVSLYLVPVRLAVTGQFPPGLDGAEIIDMSIPRKLLLWAYTLLRGRYSNISSVVKYCEEHVKPKMKKGAGGSSASPATNISAAPTAPPVGSQDGTSHAPCSDIGGCAPSANAAASSLPKGMSVSAQSSNDSQRLQPIEMSVSAQITMPSSNDSQRLQPIDPGLHHCSTSGAQKSSFDLNDEPPGLDKS